MANPVLAATLSVLETLDTPQLVSANNQLNGWGVIRYRGFKPLFEAGLLNEEGYPMDTETLGRALSFMVNQRLDNPVS